MRTRREGRLPSDGAADDSNTRVSTTAATTTSHARLSQTLIKASQSVAAPTTPILAQATNLSEVDQQSRDRET